MSRFGRRIGYSILLGRTFAHSNKSPLSSHSSLFQSPPPTTPTTPPTMARPSSNLLFMPKNKARKVPPKPGPGPSAPPSSSASAPLAPSASALASSSSSSAPNGNAPAGPSLKALGKQRATERPASPAVPVVSSEPQVGQDLQGRTYEEYDIFSMGTPAALGSGSGSAQQGESSGADFNVIRLYQLNSANPVPDLANPIGPIYFNRQNANDRSLLARDRDRQGAGGEDDKRDKNSANKDESKQAVQNGPNGEWRVPMIDREGNHQIDQRTGEKMWRVVQDPTLVAPEARKSDKKDKDGSRKRKGGGGGGRGRDPQAKVFARSGNFKDSEDSARGHQELNREKLPLVLEGTFPNPAYRADAPDRDRVDSSGRPIPPTVDQKWVGTHQGVESERWAALMFENTNGQQRVTLKLVDREYKFEAHRHINVPSTSYDAGNLVSRAARKRYDAQRSAELASNSSWTRWRVKTRSLGSRIATRPAAAQHRKTMALGVRRERQTMRAAATTRRPT